MKTEGTSLESVSQIKGRFNKVLKALEKKYWFKKDKWMASVHCFPNDKSPEGVTFHVFKKHWFNEDKKGIHIESYLDLLAKKQEKSYVTIHLLHSTKVPGTNLNRMALSKPFVNGIYDEVKKWPGYKFRAGKYGQQPFTKLIDGSTEDFEKALEAEVARICTKLGPTLEKCLDALSLPKNK